MFDKVIQVVGIFRPVAIVLAVMLYLIAAKLIELPEFVQASEAFWLTVGIAIGALATCLGNVTAPPGPAPSVPASTHERALDKLE